MFILWWETVSYCKNRVFVHVDGDVHGGGHGGQEQEGGGEGIHSERERKNNLAI